MNIATLIRDSYAAAAQRPFVWGTDDCLTWAAGIAEAIIGRDPIAEFRGTYDTEAGVKREMIRRGFKDMGDVAVHCFPEIHRSEVRTGDWALVPNPDGSESICVVSGMLVAGKTIDGMAKVHVNRAIRVFRVA